MPRSTCFLPWMPDTLQLEGKEVRSTCFLPWVPLEALDRLHLFNASFSQRELAFRRSRSAKADWQSPCLGGFNVHCIWFEPEHVIWWAKAQVLFLGHLDSLWLGFSFKIIIGTCYPFFLIFPGRNLMKNNPT